MSWQSDIKEWSDANDRDAKTVEAICIRKGWKPDKYLPSMKKDLLYWLDQWYTLSVKTLPSPATSLRRNPFSNTSEAKYCPKCAKKIMHIKRLDNGKMLGSCGDAFHDLACECPLCDDIM